MDIGNIIIQLQRLISLSDDALTIATLSKSIEKLKVGNISVVSTIGDLPLLPLTNDGNIYLVEDDADLYYNLGTDWVFLPLIDDNTLYAWGDNANGKLGDGTTVAKSSPVTVVGELTWSQVYAGAIHSLGLIDNGIAYAWGYNGSGTLGDNSTINKSSPVTIVGGITWSQVIGGASHSLGITDTGIAYAWGRNTDGQLGDNSIIDKSSPVTVFGGITNWSQMSAGYNHSLGLTDTSIAYAWGSNTNGTRLGDNTTVDKSSPVTVAGGITNWSQVSAGKFHSLGLTSDGIAYAWGRNLFGVLGDGTPLAKSSPVTVVGGITNWSQVSAGSLHSLGITDTGIAYAWGSNGNGPLGDNTIVDKSSPVTVVGGITNWSQVSAGSYLSLGLTDTGIAYAWGFGYALGDNTTVDKSSPVTVFGGIVNWSQVSAGGTSTIAFPTKKTL